MSDKVELSEEELSKFTIALSRVMSEQVVMMDGYMAIDLEVRDGKITPLEALEKFRVFFLPFAIKNASRLLQNDTSALINMTLEAVASEFGTKNV